MRTSMRRTWRSCATPSRRTSKWGARLIWFRPLLDFTLESGFRGFPHPENPEIPLGANTGFRVYGSPTTLEKSQTQTPTAQERVIAPMPGLSLF